MPKLWEEARAAPWQVQTDFAIPERDVRMAFNRLIGNTSLYAKHCFCFLIDGLDEYQETAQKDHKEMVKLLTSWTAAAPRDVKLCVSSREYNVFMNAFSADKRLRLHELTRFDMEAYARDKLGDVSDQKSRDKVVEAVVAKAEGIFLWVSLVVKEIRTQLDNGVDSESLVQLADSLPDELDTLYEHILKSLRKSDRRKAYQTLAMLPLSTQWNLEVSPFAYSFFDKYDADKAFAERGDFVETGMGGLTYRERAELGLKRVNGWCKGLVEATNFKIDYAHRSVPDFLENKAIKDEMGLSLTGFSAPDALCQLILTEFRLNRDPRYNDDGYLIKLLVKMRHAYRLDSAPFTFLRTLDALVDPVFWNIIEPATRHTDLTMICSGLDETYPIAFTDNRPVDLVPKERPRVSGLLLPSALSTCTCLWADHEYPVWRVGNDPTATDSVTKAVLLAYTTFASQRYRKEANWSVLDALLDQGLLTPRTRTRLAPAYTYNIDDQRIDFYCSESYADDDAGSDVASDGNSDASSATHLVIDPNTVADIIAVPQYGRIELSVWQHYLISEWCSQQNVPYKYSNLSRQDQNARFGAGLERFLRCGVDDAEIRFTVSLSGLDKNLIRAEFAFGDGPTGNGRTMTNNLITSCCMIIPQAPNLVEARDWTTIPSNVCSLKSWIESLEGVPNKDELLRLLDREEPPAKDMSLDTRREDDESPVVNPTASGLRVLLAAVERIAASYFIVLTLGK